MNIKKSKHHRKERKELLHNKACRIRSIEKWNEFSRSGVRSTKGGTYAPFSTDLDHRPAAVWLRFPPAVDRAAAVLDSCAVTRPPVPAFMPPGYQSTPQGVFWYGSADLWVALHQWHLVCAGPQLYTKGVLGAGRICMDRRARARAVCQSQAAGWPFQFASRITGDQRFRADLWIVYADRCGLPNAGLLGDHRELSWQRTEFRGVGRVRAVNQARESRRKRTRPPSF